MKKLLMTLLLCVTTLGAKAQFEKNTTYFSTSLTGLSMSYSNQEKFTLGVDVLGGFFVEQSWMLYGRFGYGHTQVSDDVTLGVGMRYYILQNDRSGQIRDVWDLFLCPGPASRTALRKYILLSAVLMFQGGSPLPDSPQSRKKPG